MNMIKKIIRKSNLCIFVLLTMTFPLLNKLPVLNNFYIVWGLAFYVSYIYAKRFLFTPIFAGILCYWIVVLLNFFSGDSYFYAAFQTLNEFVIFFVSCAMSYYYLRSSNSNIKVLLNLFCFFLIESCIVTYIVTLTYPGILRQLSNSESIAELKPIVEPLLRLGMSDYILPHVVPVIIPGLIYMITISRGFFYRFLYLITLISCLVLANVSGSFTALLISILSLIMSIVISFNRIRKPITFLVFIILLFLPLMLNKNLQLSTVHMFGDIFSENHQVQKKILDIENLIVTGNIDGTIEARTSKIDITKQAISENFLFGTNNPIGGHNAIIDRFATLGLIGFMPYVVFIYCQIKYTIKYIIGRKRLYYYTGLTVGLLMMFSKSMSSWPMWFLLFLLLPGTLLIQKK